jgi:hypothetical protein
LKSLELTIFLQTTNNGTIIPMKALLNCRATGLFIGTEFMRRKGLTTKKLSQSILVYNVDGTLNEAGSILEVWEATLQYHDHLEWTTFAVTGLGGQDVILGLSWLREHNPEVDWQSDEVKMSCCLNHCHTCQNEANTEQKAVFMRNMSICLCHAGEMLNPDVDMEDIPELSEDKEEEEEEPYIGNNALEKGDQVFIATILCKAEVICAMPNISQRLAEAFYKNLKPKSFTETIPSHLHNFKDLFSKSSFNHLSDQKVWDHAIKLVPNAKPSNCKVS